MKPFTQDQLDDWGRTEVCYRRAIQRVYWLLAALIWVFAAFLLFGCQTSQPDKPVGPLAVPSALMPPAVKPITKTVKVVANPPVLAITLEWTPNYLAKFPSEQTAIEACSNLISPGWSTVFTGQTSQCVMAVSQPQQFFRAYNFVP